ncbi:MAG TPA: hypothetical protein ENK50_04425 [Sedimenticola sp.]|nr:hypothetical protein [Sedimenticola sp.]
MSATSIRRKEQDAANPRLAEWERKQSRVRTLWVVVVLFFWFSVGLQVVLFFMSGKANFVLLSVISGMMVLGVTLKLRLQRILRQRPDS